MAITQTGIGELTLANKATRAAVYITVPEGAIVESVNEGPGGSPDFEDQKGDLGEQHTRLTYEKRMDTATIVLVGKAYTKQAGDVDGTNYYVESVDVEHVANGGPLRTTINVTKVIFTA
jgi:hypothetical protein